MNRPGGSRAAGRRSVTWSRWPGAGRGRRPAGRRIHRRSLRCGVRFPWASVQARPQRTRYLRATTTRRPQLAASGDRARSMRRHGRWTDARGTQGLARGCADVVCSTLLGNVAARRGRLACKPWAGGHWRRVDAEDRDSGPLANSVHRHLAEDEAHLARPGARRGTAQRADPDAALGRHPATLECRHALGHGR